MPTSEKGKRLDQIDAQLTPKEWAIRNADELRKFPSLTSYYESHTPETLNKAIDALMKQAEAVYPSKNPGNAREYNQLARRLWAEFATLSHLFSNVNITIHEEAEKIGLRAAMKLSALHTLILQDAFGRTARNAALWVEEYKTADKEEEENRQIMLKELAAYTDVNFGERFTDSLPLGPDLRLRFPTMIEEWVKGTVELIKDVFAYQAAVKTVQDKYFDGHPILALDFEAALDNTIKTIQDGADTFNEYLKTRSALFKSDWDDEEKEDGIASAIPGEREGLLTIDIAAIKDNAIRQSPALVESWVKRAKVEISLKGNPENAYRIAHQYFREVSGLKA